MNRSIHTSLGLLAVLLLPVVASPQEAETPAVTEDLLSGLKLRGIGPASRSGRIADVAMDPNDSSTWYMAVASGNAFKTTNRGTTWEPIFENYPVYSTSTVVVDPTNSNVIWLGTGENNGQRSVPYGNGVWRSRDAGARSNTWGSTSRNTSARSSSTRATARPSTSPRRDRCGGLAATGASTRRRTAAPTGSMSSAFRMTPASAMWCSTRET